MKHKFKIGIGFEPDSFGDRNGKTMHEWKTMHECEKEKKCIYVRRTVIPIRRLTERDPFQIGRFRIKSGMTKF